MLQRGRCYTLTYIDNRLWLVLGAECLPFAWYLLSTYIALMTSVGLEVKASELVFPSSAPLCSLGYLILSDFTRDVVEVRPRPNKLLDLLQRTRDAMKLRVIAPRLFASLLGEWLWFTLLRRPALSVLSNGTFAFARAEAGLTVRSLPPLARLELLMLSDLAPLLFATISAPWCTRTWAFDAAGPSVGHHGTMAVVSTPSAIFTSPLPAMSHSPSHTLASAVVAANWRLCFAVPFRRHEHITAFEASAAVAALSSAAFYGSAHHCRWLGVGDATAPLSALTKGRSSSVPINGRCRKSAVIQLAFSIFASWAYVDTSIMPADPFTRPNG